MKDSNLNQPHENPSRRIEPVRDLVSLLSQKVVGQSSATKAIVPYVYMYQSGLAPELKEAGWEMLTADNAAHARRLFSELRPGAVLLDYMLGDDDGLELGLEFQAGAPETKVMMMTGGALSDDELVICGERNIPILLKPFLAQDILNLARGAGHRSFAAGMGVNKSAESL